MKNLLHRARQLSRELPTSEVEKLCDLKESYIYILIKSNWSQKVIDYLISIELTPERAYLEACSKKVEDTDILLKAIDVVGPRAIRRILFGRYRETKLTDAQISKLWRKIVENSVDPHYEYGYLKDLCCSQDLKDEIHQAYLKRREEFTR